MHNENQPSRAIPAGNYAEKQLAVDRIDRNPTVGENIDSKISILKAEIARLEESKVTLAPLLGMKIRDIREATNY